MISLSKRKTSVAQTPRATSRANDNGSTTQPCNCVAEITLLNEAIASLRSDLLMHKQTQTACDALRSEQLKYVSSTLNDIKRGISDAVSSLNNSLECINTKVGSIQNICIDNEAVQSKFIAVNSRIESLESFLDTSGVVVVEKLPMAESAPSVTKTVDPLAVFYPSVMESQQIHTDPEVDAIENFLQGKITTSVQTDCTDVDVGVQCDLLTTPPNSVLARPDTRNHSQFVSNVSSRGWRKPVTRHVTFKDIIETIGTKSEPRYKIPTRTTDRSDGHNAGGFIVSPRKHTKRYFVGGFKNRITENDIYKYVSSRGPKVTMVRIFPSKRNKSDVIVRVNVEDNENSSLLESDYFWPEGYTCQPWLSRTQRMTRRKQRPNDYTGRQYNRTLQCNQIQSNFRSYNRYTALDCDIDID